MLAITIYRGCPADWNLLITLVYNKPLIQHKYVLDTFHVVTLTATFTLHDVPQALPFTPTYTVVSVQLRLFIRTVTLGFS